ncbi:50S ribosomal protein L15 [Alphaproteobacteria bacterium endosymbiont of Tiliacea citrago]|uniref:50S ribosomal protein L15 n=1 Tax=Alphaproteobacteria bacterium endosymbiont of Tiliacea citrago TaxID=3077944 RepID=UPI00313CA8C0
MKLNELQFIPGSMKKSKRAPRGNSGKQAGTGKKGQKARSGVSLGNFQGGQTPLERRIPKHNSFFVKKDTTELPLNRLLPLFDSGLIDEKTVLTRSLLEQFGLVKKRLFYKIVGTIDKTINIEAHKASEGAKKAIESNNGKLVVLERKK